MFKEVLDLDPKAGIFRITTLGERWYLKPSKNKATGLPQYDFYPSVTWIAGCYPKGVEFYKWLAAQGWNESQAIKREAGERGTRIHQACEAIDAGKIVTADTPFPNEGGQPSALTPDEYHAVMTFCSWLDVTKPELLANEMTVFSEDFTYAGTLDRIYRIDGTIWIVDIKSSKSVWKEYELQLSAYSNADVDVKALGITDAEWAARKLAILQVGYPRNKNGYKWNELEDKFSLFCNAMAVWKEENDGATPLQRDFPLEIAAKCRKPKPPSV